jgi:two-component system, NtrC family, response regulator HydG
MWLPKHHTYGNAKEALSLRQSEERHRDIIDLIEEGYLEVDLRGTTAFCNDAFCRITGYPRQELLGLNYKEYMDEDMAKLVYAAYNEAYRTGVPNRGFPYEIIRKNGERRIIENSISLMKNSQGHRIGFRSVVRDITDRRQAEEQLERNRSRLQAIFRSVRDAIITVDPDMVVVESNKAAESICGLIPERCTGEVLSDCSNQCLKRCHQVIRQALRDRITIKEHELECRHIHRPQQKVSITISPLLNRFDEFTGSVVVIRDITKLRNLELELKEKLRFKNIIGKNRKMQEIYGLMESLADLDTTVLITGESGTGKSLAAKALHYTGRRSASPVVTVNCSVLSENLLESELFGHVKGAFTGAIRDSQGRFQSAQGGTILMDEIGDIPLRTQVKLLRVLEEREFERVGESKPIKVDARVIACTNKDLKEKVKSGEFREDLYYRLKVMEVAIPPLRRRLEDLPLLVEHFCNIFNKRFRKNILGLSDEVLSLFMNYRWPGNVRELKHSIEHAFVLCNDSIISLDHIPMEIREFVGPKKWLREKRNIDDPDNIRAVLDKTDWNKTKTARILGIDRSTIYRKIQKYGLSRTADKV